MIPFIKNPSTTSTFVVVYDIIIFIVLQVLTNKYNSLLLVTIGKDFLMSKLNFTAGTCPVEVALSLIGGKWKILILWHLFYDGTLRFGELKKALPGVTQKMLIEQLKDMEADGLVIRTVYAQMPPKVEYSLTELGKSIKCILDPIYSWGEKYKDKLLSEK
jgi:DNA-binding HxlR family transcriptional regulator